MRQHPNAIAGVLFTRTSLQQLVNRLMVNSLAAALHNKSSVVNEVDREIVINGENPKLVSIISELLATVISNSRNGNIHVTADMYMGVVILSIEERNNYNGYALAYSVGSIGNEATTIGGHISIKGPQQKVATVSFSFPVQMAAA